MVEALSSVTNEPSFEPVESNLADQLPPELEALSEKHFGDCNVRSYFVKIGMAQEQMRDGKINNKLQELRAQRANLADITTFLDIVNANIKTNPSAKDISLTGHNELTDRLMRLLPDDQRLRKSKLTRTEAELLCHAMTRKSDQEITPNIQDISTDMTHIIEDLDKLLPILKELMKSYDDLINRINNKPK